jgi:hypothetical protein
VQMCIFDHCINAASNLQYNSLPVVIIWTAYYLCKVGPLSLWDGASSGLEWRRWPSWMDVSCEYVEQAVVDR